MMKKYGPGGYPHRFPYRSKALFAFQVINDPATGFSHEVCFFGLYVQEYGTNCAQPNQRRVYIAYLDSVHYFQPSQLRTSIFYEILLAYLQAWLHNGPYLGMPPSEGDDFIFHCHPPGQKIPDAERLQKWYKTMLDIGKEEGTIHSYRNIYTQAKEDNLDTPMKLPYFQGDYWPRKIDEYIVSAEKKEECQKQQKEEENTSTDISDDVFDDMPQTAVKQQKSNNGKKKMKKKKNLKKKGTQNKKKASKANSVVDKLYQHMKKQQNEFFTIRLFSQNVIEEKMPAIVDPDPLISCELMDTRDNFLAKSREHNWEFSQFRRAKWSTANFCFMLHAQTQQAVSTQELIGLEETVNKELLSLHNVRKMFVQDSSEHMKGGASTSVVKEEADDDIIFLPTPVQKQHKVRENNLGEQLGDTHKQFIPGDAAEDGCGSNSWRERIKMLEAAAATLQKSKENNKYQHKIEHVNEAIKPTNLARRRGLQIARPIRPGQQYGPKLL